jgi:hypothetical protein
MDQEHDGGRKSEVGRMPRAKPSAGMPGDRAALATGALTATFQGAHGDENREPPANAPSPVMPASTVKDRRAAR